MNGCCWLLRLGLLSLGFVSGCGKYEAIQETEDLTEEVRARMTAGAEKYRLAGWKSRSIEQSPEPVPLSQNNVAIVLSVPSVDNASLQRGAGLMRVNGTFAIDPKTLVPTNLDLQIDAKSVQTPRETWTAFLQDKSVLNSDEYPTIDFKCKSIGEGKRIAERKVAYPVVGELTIAGQSHELTLPLELETSDGRMAFACQCNLDLSKYASGALKESLTGPCTLQMRCPFQAFVPDDEEAIMAAIAASNAGSRGGEGGAVVEGEAKGTRCFRSRSVF